MGRPSNNDELLLLPFVRSGRYHIDAQGRVWRINRLCCIRAENDAGDYLQVRRIVDGKRLHVLAHRLVWVYFNGPIPDGLEINHENGRKKDNWPDNLEPMTGSDNLKHAHATGLIDQRGERNPAAKLTAEAVALIRGAYAAGGVTQEQLGALHGVSFKTISKIVRGERRRVDGGQIADYTIRRSASRRKAAGRLLDGKLHDEYPT